MTTLARTYRESLALLTDLYEVTMAYGYWKSGRSDQEAVFHLFFRELPFHGGFAVACGLASAVEFLEQLRFTDDDLAYLAELTGADGTPLFEAAFLDFLRELRFSCDVEMIPEGTVVFPQEPLVRVRGPIIQAQLVESALLNLVNFQTLIATQAARVCLAARGEPVLEFGLRRAQGIDGALSASRAAYVGGCVATSNLLAGKLYGIPVRGTHAHSWVMSFDSELESFEAYARAMPNNTVFLVDTYDSIEGVRHAVEVARRLRAGGHRLLGVRLDSGDLAYLSKQARRILDDAGFADVPIMASSELDEDIITSLKLQGAPIAVWAVGTKLVTAAEQPALGGVYKLSAVRRDGGDWEPKIKLSEQAVKVSTPGMLQVLRFEAGGEFSGDMIFDELHPLPPAPTIVDPLDMTRRKHFPAGSPAEPLLVPVFREGRRVYDPPPLAETRQRTTDQLARFHEGVKRFVNPHRYPVGLEFGLHERKTALILRARGEAQD
ncbi:MAG TPA: nicotinate phosphoribosyltransferase [Longimicrobiaceae bacterium]|nr:nicotinate phosphoribosyltransferase [Longimicrobiaceae bacterium]